jgi:hypothetical protein
VLIGFSLHVCNPHCNRQEAIRAVENPYSTGSHESESLIKAEHIKGSILQAAVTTLLNFLCNYLTGIATTFQAFK